MSKFLGLWISLHSTGLLLLNSGVSVAEIVGEY